MRINWDFVLNVVPITLCIGFCGWIIGRSLGMVLYAGFVGFLGGLLLSYMRSRGGE
jgi:hypothetical protein